MKQNRNIFFWRQEEERFIFMFKLVPRITPQHLEARGSRRHGRAENG